MAGLRGYAPYKPQAKAAEVIAQVRAMLADPNVLGSIRPVTVRQIFYRLVAMHGYPKDEGAYETLGVILTRARRARMIAFEDITDSGIKHARNSFDAGPDDQIAVARSLLNGAGYRLDPQAGQARRLVVWCEADGLVAQAEAVAREYGVDVVANGGQPSLSFNKWIADRVAGLAQAGGNAAVEILMLGDYDPPGFVITRTGGEDVVAFALADHAIEVEVTRIALIREQVVARGIVTSPFTKKDTRYAPLFGHPWPGVPGDPDACAQLEAIAPPELQALLREEIEARLDPALVAAVKARQARDVEVIRKAGRRLDMKPPGRPPSTDPVLRLTMRLYAKDGASVREIAKMFGVSRSVAHRALKEGNDGTGHD